MGTCINHPDRETPYICMKHQIYLCEACLECRDPKIYCKHRSAYPIWFMSKRKAGWEAKDRQAAATHTVTFLPDGRTVSVPAGSTLLEAAPSTEIHVNASCSGKGSCGKCKLMVVAPMLQEILKAGKIGLKANPMAAVFIMPGPASYVGGDIVSGILYTGFHREEPVTLFIDVGTNGEIVLGNKEWLMTAACSAGPAFEGGGIRFTASDLKNLI